MMNQTKFKQGLFLLLIITILASCQEKKLTLVDEYIGDTDQFGLDIVALKDGGSIIGTRGKTQLIRLSGEVEKDKKVVWQKDINDATIKSMIADDDNVIVLAEKYTEHINGTDTSFTNHLKFIKISQAGDIIWEVIDSSMTYVRGDDLINLGNGKFGVLGVIKSFSTNDSLEHYPILALTIDSNGKIIWKKTFSEYEEIGGVSFKEGNLINTSDGGMVMTWITRFKVRDDYYPEGFCVFKLDAEGNLIWKKKVIMDELFTKEEVGMWAGRVSEVNIVKNSNDEYLIVGESMFDNWAMKLDANGKRLWKKTLDLQHLFNLTDVVSINDNLFIINSVIRGEGANQQSFINLVAIDGDGNVLWENKDEVKEQSNGYALDKGVNNDVYVVGGILTGDGYFDSFSNFRPLVMRHYKIKD